MNFEHEKIEAQFAKYIKKVIHDTATNYYKKKYHHREYELLLDNFQEYSLGIESKEVIFSTALIFGHPIVLDDKKFIIAITKLKEREQVFLLEKFLMGKTDKEIRKPWGITRQGVTNLKHRAYKKIRCEYDRKK